jgi:hypothetical protein
MAGKELFDILKLRLNTAIMLRDKSCVDSIIAEMRAWRILKRFTAEDMKDTLSRFKGDTDSATEFCKQIMFTIDPVALIPATYALKRGTEVFRSISRAYYGHLLVPQLSDIIVALLKIEPSTNNYWWFVDYFNCTGDPHYSAVLKAFPLLKGIPHEYDNKNKVFKNMFTGEIIYKL